jgi:fatty-acyl-CoA synthase
MGNQPEYLFALFGAARVGAVVVGINDTRRGEELARDIRHTDCAAVLCDDSRAPLLAGLDLGGATVLVVTETEWRERLAAAAPVQPLAVHADHLWVLIFTSGSTGAPKAVRMTQGRARRRARPGRRTTTSCTARCRCFTATR